MGFLDASQPELKGILRLLFLHFLKLQEMVLQNFYFENIQPFLFEKIHDLKLANVPKGDIWSFPSMVPSIVFVLTTSPSLVLCDWLLGFTLHSGTLTPSSLQGLPS